MQVILGIVGSILGLVTTWYVGKRLTQLVQAYRTGQQKDQAEEDRKNAQAQNQKDNKESSDLDKIAGR